MAGELVIHASTEARIRELADANSTFGEAQIAELAGIEIHEFRSLSTVDRATVVIGVRKMVIDVLQRSRNADLATAAVGRLDGHVNDLRKILDAEIVKRDRRNRWTRASALVIGLAIAAAGAWLTARWSSQRNNITASVSVESEAGKSDELGAALPPIAPGPCEGLLVVQIGDTYDSIAFRVLAGWNQLIGSTATPSEIDLQRYRDVLIARNGHAQLRAGDPLVIPPVVPADPVTTCA